MRITTTEVFLIACAWTASAADTSAIQSVFVLNSEICISNTGGNSVQQLTDDGLRKSLPVWSTDGKKIAFVRTSARPGLGDIVVLSPAGEELWALPFRPSDAHVTGMRFIEELEWISLERLMVSGSVDPSTVEYVVVDVHARKELGGYLTNGLNLAFSPDGKHVAYEAAVPHFTPQENRRPRLCLDDGCDPRRASGGYPSDSERHIEFATYPVWSPSSSVVAVLAQDYRTNGLLLIAQPAGGQATEFPLPASSPGRSILGYNSENEKLYRIYWGGETAFAVAGDAAWKLERHGTALIPVLLESVPTADITAALQLRRVEEARFKALGASQVDSWCASCGLQLLPRRNGPRETSQ
jgi:WD40-like Beta Propeller Repeat